MSAHATDLPPPRSIPSPEARHDAPSYDDAVDADDELEPRSSSVSIRASARMPRLGIPEGTQFHVLSFEGLEAGAAPELLREAWRQVAPKKLLDSPQPPAAKPRKAAKHRR